jgi:hypothetical protein
VKRDELISSHPAINIQNSDNGDATHSPSICSVEDNLKTLLGTFSEGRRTRDPLLLCLDMLTSRSLRVYHRQLLRGKVIRVESILDR